MFGYLYTVLELCCYFGLYAGEPLEIKPKSSTRFGAQRRLVQFANLSYLSQADPTITFFNVILDVAVVFINGQCFVS